VSLLQKESIFKTDDFVGAKRELTQNQSVHMP
jgi:hypothetical protein